MEDDKLKSIIDKISMTDKEESGFYKGVEVTLNKPFLSDDKNKALAVYSKNSVGDVVLVRFLDKNNLEQLGDQEYTSRLFENYKCDVQKDMSTPSFWMCRVIADDTIPFADKAMSHKFNQKVFFDFADKTVRSVRDGVQEYYGAELGLEPYDKVFAIYRRPETITAIVKAMDGLPVIEDHIDPEITPSADLINGVIKDTEVVEYDEGFKDSTLYLKNKLAMNDKGLSALSRGKRELSLGYLGQLIEHDVYDFEQIEIEPTHLAIVDRARGGDVLTFEDKQKQIDKDADMKLNFIDEEGKLSLQKVAEMVAGFQEAIKNAPLEEVVKVMPSLQDLMTTAKENAGMSEDQEAVVKSTEEVVENQDMEAEEAEVVVEDEADDSEEETKMTDEDAEEKEEKEGFADSQAFKDAVDLAVSEKFKTVEKAKQFLDDGYAFEDKSAFAIKKDAVEKHLGKSFEDSKVEGAFEALQLNENPYGKFGDSADDAWEKIKNVEI